LKNAYQKKEAKMKKGILVLFALAIILSGLSLSPAQAQSQPIELSLSLMVPPKHLRNIHVFEPWIKLVEERTQGKVKIKRFYSSTLAQPQESFDAAASGVCDMAESYTFGNPGRFLLTETLMLPEMGFPTALSCTRALWHLYKTFPEVQAEYKGVKMLWLHSTPGAKLNTKKKPVKNLEDLKGMKIAVSGATMVKVGKALGLSPVTVSTNDLYEAGDKGVIDGFVRPVELLISRKLAEVSKYVTDIDLGHDLFFVVMNQKKWDSLPPDVQKVLTELSGDWAVEFTGKAWDQFDQQAAIDVKAKGIEFITMPDQEVAKWRKLLRPVQDEYAKDLEAKKLPGKKIMEELKKLAAKGK
jgi:TRAP-type C4-dicarboxylate transport system substrate-binding protein